MKLKISLITVLFLLFLSFSVKAQLSGETEAGSDGKGESFLSEYLFYDFLNVNLFGRYLWINNILERGEFAIGPTITFKDTSLIKVTVGMTTYNEAVIDALLLTKFGGKDALYLFDLKITTEKNIPNTLYHKLALGINKKSTLQVRIEHLTGNYWGKKSDEFDGQFLRIGLEYQQKFSVSEHPAHIYVAPFYDPVRKALGGQAGFRFF